ncbi:hypothetical protein [Phyllobacterium chamaecytisi]|uniref:hypothetical protein n=1 Tax=Phyllobacterium chamaecytisi TaxID=2876082 RepID=UPI001CCF8482|nr:hypothetical protein [Phyllobacterium sp. KW56]MBZ9600467.1 hypothetical protein [Phyllobacterium sp. KW56]
MAHKPARLQSLKSTDGGGTFDDMEHRVAFLEKSFEKLDGKLDVIINSIAGLKEDVSILKGEVSGLKGDVSGLKGDVAGLKEGVAYMKGKVETLPTVESFAALSQSLGQLTGHVHTLPSAAAFGELKGRVDSLPTTAKLASLLAVAVGVIAIINKWPRVIDAVFGW